MAERNAALRAEEAAEAAAIAAAREAREAEEALGLAAQSLPDGATEWQEEQEALRRAGRDQAEEAHTDAMEHQRAERIAAALAAEAARRETEEGRNEPGPSQWGASPAGAGPSENVVHTIPGVLGWARRLYSGARLGSAARSISIETVDDTLRIFGPRAARTAAGLRPYVNIVLPENAPRILQSPLARARGGLVTGGTVLGLASNVITNGSLFISGETDRFEFAAALTLDTGITIASGLLGGFIAGAVSGAVVGGIAGFGIGAIPAAVIGGLAGIGGTMLLQTLFERSGARELVVDRIADMFRSWVGH
jgi:hypothetical protein